MVIICEYCNFKIRQNEDNGYLNVDDIVIACNDGKSSSYYSLDDWMQLGITTLLASRDKKLLYIPWFSRDEENCLYVCSLLAEAFANMKKQFSLAAALDSFGYQFSWKKKLNNSLEQTDINDDKPKHLMNSNDYHWFTNTISYLEETQDPEDMKLARLLRENLRSKI
jgi:hypothetical protein